MSFTGGSSESQAASDANVLAAGNDAETAAVSNVVAMSGVEKKKTAADILYDKTSTPNSTPQMLGK